MEKIIYHHLKILPVDLGGKKEAVANVQSHTNVQIYVGHDYNLNKSPC